MDEMKNRNILKEVSIIVGYALFLVMISECVSRASMISTMMWTITHPGLLLSSIALVAGIIAIITWLTKKMSIAIWSVSIPFTVLSIVNYYKILMNSKPLTIWDFGLIDELLKIQGDMSFTIAWHAVILAGVVIGVNIILVRIINRTQVVSLTVRSRWLKLSGAIIVTGLIVSGIYLNPTVFDFLGFDDTPFNQVTFYENNGFLNALIYGINDKLALTNVDSTEEGEQIAQAQAQFYEETTVGIQRPNIILLLNESFMDVTQIENVTFNQDPLPTYRALQNETITGTFVSSQFGGGTSNVEYDVLTANTSFDLPKGMVPYTQLIHQEIESLPQLLASYGYQNTSIHSYTGWYWNRESVHQSLGFERFLDETTFENPTYIGPYISDADFMTKIIDTFEENKASDPNRPQFIFGISMQNHAPYGGSEKSIGTEVPIEITSSEGLSPENEEILEDYAQSTYLSDQALGQLLTYFASVDEPTIVLQFGDHLPSMATLLTEAGYLQNEAQTPLEQALTKYTTPMLVWDNQNRLPSENIGYIGANFIAPFLLEQAQLPLSPYYQFLQTMKEMYGMPFFEYILQADGSEVNQIETTIDWQATYEYLQYTFLGVR